eukprot:Pgem_evm1s1441
MLSCLKTGTVLFVDTADLDYFFAYFAKTIPVPFVLLTGDSDYSTPTTQNVDKLLALYPKILHWYGMNSRVIISDLSTKNRQKYSILPNGFSQWGSRTEILGPLIRKWGLKNGQKPSITQQKSKPIENTILVSFNLKTNPPQRNAARNHLCNSKIMKGHATCPSKMIENFEQVMSTYRWVASPHGMGLDCYRTYEALYFGVFVVVQSSTLDPFYENLPVLIVKNWSDVSPDLLNEKYIEFSKKQWNYDKIYTGYWKIQVRSHRDRSEKMIY